MTRRGLRTLLVGFGNVGALYAEDPVMARHFPYATHAQVLAAHPAFAWEAVVDRSEAALGVARDRWQIPHVARCVEELPTGYHPQVAVLAIPPGSRLAVVRQLHSVRAVLVEKPLGVTTREAEELLSHCNQRGIKVQVNLWRRADETFRTFATGRLKELIGQCQAAFGVYGNGLLNNGTHMIDFVRMLLGEIEGVQAVGRPVGQQAGPIPDDVDLAFDLRLADGLVVMMQSIRFRHYRENSLDLWGEKARLSIVQEGLGILLYPRCDNRAMQGEWEIASDTPQALESTAGRAFYRMYSNLAAALEGDESLWSPGDSALQTSRVVEAVKNSARCGGALVELN